MTKRHSLKQKKLIEFLFTYEFIISLILTNHMNHDIYMNNNDLF